MEIKLNKRPTRQFAKTTHKYAGGSVSKVQSPNVDNAKVKVQFIDHSQQLPNKVSLEKDRDLMSTDESIENVEYLDDEYAQVESLTNCDDVHRETKKSTADCENVFYQNAMHCLIDTYHEKYQEMHGKSADQIEAMNVWEDIAVIMHETYFDFNAEQVKRKFKHLRSKYFNMTNTIEVDSFEYFDQLHELYQDPVIDSIAAGEARSQDMQTTTLQANYPDECLMLEQEQFDDSNEIPTKSTTREHLVTVAEQREIMHKEHEFIDMMEKELQALDGSCIEAANSADVHVTHAEQPLVASAGVILLSSEKQIEVQNQSATRDRPTETISAKRLKLEDKGESFKQGVESPVALETATSLRDISLADYNAHQERRHQEKMQLFQQYMALQERALKMQDLLFEQLIKRTQ